VRGSEADMQKIALKMKMHISDIFGIGALWEPSTLDLT